MQSPSNSNNNESLLLLFWWSREKEGQIYSIVFKCFSYIIEREGSISPSSFDGQLPNFSFMPWPYKSTEWFVISPFQVVCGTWDSVATREVPVSWEESWHEMYAAKRTQKYSMDDKEIVRSHHITYAF